MKIEQWEDKGLSHFSYAVLSECSNQIALIDPARNPQPYLDFAKQHGATIVAVIETHPHADFVSNHLEIANTTGATIYTHSLVNAAYAHTAFDDGQSLQLGNIKLTSIHTPGHSPDSISILLEHHQQLKAVFTGDTLFIGDCGRPGLREGAGNIKAKRENLAKLMYASLRQKLMPLADDVVVYPAHRAGSLCGKALSSAHSSTMGAEKRTNWSLQQMSEPEFVKELLTDQPFIPAYFPFDVELNRVGADPFAASVKQVKIGEPVTDVATAKRLDTALLVVDVRNEKVFKEGHLPRSVNIMEGEKFETWLGSIIQPEEPFYLAGESDEQLQKLLQRIAAIGYEKQVREAFVVTYKEEKSQKADKEKVAENSEAFTIVDVRNASEVKQKIIFPNAINIPLGDLRKRVGEIPTEKPILVHCAGGYRSAAGSSLIAAQLQPQVAVLDLGEAVKSFEPQLKHS